jgi:hypothetical protein
MGANTDQKWSAARTRKMTRLADQGMSTSQIADALGLTRNQVLGKMYRLGLKTKNPPQREWPKKWLNTRLVKKLTKLASQRLSAEQIGKALGLTRGQARYRMRRLGLKTTPKAEWPAELAAKIPGLIEQGLSNRRIAKALGLTLGQVINKLRRLGLKTRNAAPGSRPRIATEPFPSRV